MISIRLATTQFDRELTVGSIWRHYKGGLYKILATGIIDANNDKSVLYSNSDGKLFIQTEARFTSYVVTKETPDHPNPLFRTDIKPRFAKVEDELFDEILKLLEIKL
jgi:hypothetical protein